MASQSLTLKTTVTGDVDMYPRTADRMKHHRGFLRVVGVYIMARSLQRLVPQLGYGTDVVRTGRLTSSIGPSPTPQQPGDTINDLSDHKIVVGSNVPYAAIMHFGGTIRPIPPNRALAWPRKRSLQLGGGIQPSQLDPDRKVLEFIPTKHAKSIGVLVDKKGTLGHGKGILYVLIAKSRRDPRPYLHIDEQDEDYIVNTLWPRHLEGALGN